MSNTKRGKALRAYMKGRGVARQAHMARELRVSEATISRYFAGTRFFSPRTALRIAKQTGIPMEALFQ